MTHEDQATGLDPIRFSVTESKIVSDERLPSAENRKHPLRGKDTVTIVNPDFEEREAYNAVDIVVIGGSSGVGKTSLFAHAKRALENGYACAGAVLFPERDVNRPPRDTDEAFGESRQVEDPELLDPDTDYAVRWLRNLGEQIYAYGFKDIGKHAVVVLSGNNALLKHLSDNPDLLRDSQGRQRVLRIGVYTDEEVRAQRFLARSVHEITPQEIAARLSDPTATAKDPHLVDITIDNSVDVNSPDRTYYTNARAHLTRFLEQLAARRDITVEMKLEQENDRGGYGGLMGKLNDLITEKVAKENEQAIPESDITDK